SCCRSHRDLPSFPYTTLFRSMITVACVATLLFFGGWHGPVFGHSQILTAILPVFWFAAKVFAFLFLYIWVRGTLPRFRYDQLMRSEEHTSELQSRSDLVCRLL